MSDAPQQFRLNIEVGDLAAALSSEVVHGLEAGDISVKPWGERSFYANDPWGNPLCFVEAGTEYAG
jgi:hypothetical protein